MSSNSLTTLSYAARRELIERAAPLYHEASLAQKELLLDRMVTMTGYARKYAIHLLNHAPAGKRTIHRRRQPRYKEIQHVLLLAWKAAKYICAKRLIPFLPTLVAALERHGYLQLSEESRSLLLQISTTAERFLRSHRPSGPRGLCTTQAGSLLKHHILIRTFHGWDNAHPGFLEADLVAHNGGDSEGLCTPSASPMLPQAGPNASRCSIKAQRRFWPRSNRHEGSFRFRSWGWTPTTAANSCAVSAHMKSP